jgi:3-hydroxyisobutyrate dehydrogenase-like beta-hydroxyacid dehydrogenase
MKVGFIGLGRMGGGCCSNIIKKGYDTTVYDISCGAMKKFEEHAKLASSIEEVFTSTDVTILSLPGYPEVEAAADRFLEAGVKGRGVIDISTSYPTSSRKIHDKFKAAGGHYLDAPLTGSPVMAAEGTLVVNVGGDEEDYELYKEVISAFSKISHYIGASGAGNIAKLLNNYLSIMYVGLYAEAFPLAEKMGYDVEKLFNIIADSSINCRNYQSTVPKMCIDKTFTPGFSLNFCLKDLTYLKMLFEEYKAPSFILDGGIDMFKTARIMGLGEKDSSEVAKVTYKNLGIEIK